MNTLLSLLIPASLLFAAPSPDGDGERGHRHYKLQELDTDGSGTLSATEVEGTRIAEHFAQIDTDGDGELTKDELKAGRKGGKGKRGRGKQHLEALDADGSGTLSATEVEGTRLAEHFAEIDSNGDGELAKDELKAAHEARRAARKEREG